MNPYDYAGRITCPHCHAAVGEKCTTSDGHTRSLPCLARTRLTDWPDIPEPPNPPPARPRATQRYDTPPDPSEPRHQEHT